jgi:uncharacterized protein YgbK (DUF1537 family)
MIGVIADDLTGAAELGAVGTRYGLKAVVVTGEEVENPADLICIDTDSRLCPSAEAARRASAAALQLRNAGAEWIYKKVDSVLRGRVIPEVEAIMAQLGLKLALLAPANPSLGRTIKEGNYFIHGKAIDQTEFARDPWYPRKSARVLELVDTATSSMHVCRLGEPLPAQGIAICGVGSVADVREWASRRGSEALPAGGAEFFAALLDEAGFTPGKPKSISAIHSAEGSELFVCGSTSESCQQFLTEAVEDGSPVTKLPVSLLLGKGFTQNDASKIATNALEALKSHRRIILSVGLPLVTEQNLARSLAGYLGMVATEVIRRSPVGRVFAEGGTTAIELVRQMNWRRLPVIGELALGVATLGVEDSSPLLFTIKPGSYYWPESVRQRRAA